MRRLAETCARHRRAVLAIWVVVLIGLTAATKIFPAEYSNSITLPGTQSQQAADLLDREFPSQSGDTDQIVIQARKGRITDPAVKAAVGPMLAKVARLPYVNRVQSPYGPQGGGQVSQDRSIAFATVHFTRFAQNLPLADVQRVIDTAKGAAGPAVGIELGGAAISRTERTTPQLSELIGLMAAMVVLLITFGSLTAMGLPIATALLALGSGLALLALGSRVIDTADFAPQLAAMLGLGVGIDYALFIVTRYRDAHAANGGQIEPAIVESMQTAGRAVLFAGATVVIAILGMCLLGVSFLYGVAISTSAVVLVTLVASLTVTPALLAFGPIGRRIASGRGGRKRSTSEGRLWGSWADTVVRHRWICAFAGLALLIALTLPSLSMRQLHNDAGNDSPSQTTRKAYDLLADGFGPGFNGPMLFVVSTPKRLAPEALSTVRSGITANPGISATSPPSPSPSGTTATFSAYPETAPQDSRTSDLVASLREQVAPALGRQTGTQILIGGFTPATIDLADTFANKLPVFIGVVVLLSALLLMVVFRSLLVPVKAAVMNLLSIGAALGVVTLVFEKGWGADLLGVQPGPIEPFLPVMMFAIIFGLSMDYEVFIVSRIREEYLRSGDPRGAVRTGLAMTGRVVTAAAMIMVLVFISFMFGGDRVIKMFGLGLATAVFIDAFVIRVILLPAIMDLAASATWWLPGWLDRLLPDVSIELPAE